MFQSTRKNPGLTTLLAVALVIAGYLAGAGLAVKSYVDAGEAAPAVAAQADTSG